MNVPPNQSKNSPTPRSCDLAVPANDYRSLFSSTPDPCLVLDPKLVIVAANDAYLNATMTKCEDIIGRHIFEVFPDNPSEANATGVRNLHASLERVLANQVTDMMAVQKYDIRKPADEGGDFVERYWSPVNTPVFGANSEIAYIIHRVEDMTDYIHLKKMGVEEHKLNEALRERAVQMDAEIYARSQEIAEVNLKLKLAEEELRKARDNLEQEVEQRTRELQQTHKQYLHAEKLATIGKLSASIIHELNNPVMGILTILKGFKKTVLLEEEDEQFLDVAICESERIKDLVRNLQQLSRPSAGIRMAIDVRQTLDAVLLLQKSKLKKRRISVELNYAEDLPNIRAIPDQIKQVFLNIIINAEAACPQSDGLITISTWQEGKRIAVAIKDTGIGIDPENMELIFQPFFTTKDEGKGTGLGLSVCSDIIKKHQGEILVNSHPGVGSTFTILLPIDGE